jgi:hypothetical protein
LGRFDARITTSRDANPTVPGSEAAAQASARALLFRHFIRVSGAIIAAAARGTRTPTVAVKP